MKPITEDSLFSFNSYPLDMDIHASALMFSHREMIGFLINKGYDVGFHTGLKNQIIVPQANGAKEIKMDVMTSEIIAVKPHQILPDRLDSSEAIDMKLMNVFKREMKRLLLSI